MLLLETLQIHKDSEGYVDVAFVLAVYEPNFESKVKMVNELSLDIAKFYRSEKITYELADDLMNQIWSYMLCDDFLELSGNSIPSPAFDIYDAFDSGEWHREEDDENIDPVKKYTDPAITHILEVYA